MDEKFEPSAEEMPVEQLPPEDIPTEEKPVYTPRPKYQVWLARIALVVFVILVLLYYFNMMRGNG